MNKAVLLSQDIRVVNEFTQICAVTGMTLDVTSEIENCKTQTKYFVDATCEVESLDSDDVHVICVGQPTSKVWLLASQVDAKSILTLPHDRTTLIELLTPSVTRRGKVIAVTQAGGGCGVTTLASAIAHQLKNIGNDCVLLDVHNSYSGLDLSIGANQDKLIYSTDVIKNSDFGMDGLNIIDGLRFVPNNSTHTTNEWIGLINHLAAQNDFVVLDLRRDLLDREFASVIDEVVVALTNTIVHTAITRILLNTLQDLGIEHGLAVRSIGGTSLLPLAIADKLQTPLWAAIPSDNRITEQIECGFGVSMVRLTSFNRAIAQLTARLSGARDVVRTA